MVLLTTTIPWPRRILKVTFVVSSLVANQRRLVNRRQLAVGRKPDGAQTGGEGD